MLKKKHALKWHFLSDYKGIACEALILLTSFLVKNSKKVIDKLWRKYIIEKFK